jgi:hypothetical protein
MTTDKKINGNATKHAVAKKPKALSAKGEAQKRAGLKVTEAAKTPATPPAAKPVPAAKPAKAGKPIGELVKAVKAHGKKFAHKNGWDLLLKWSDAEIAKELEGVPSKAAAVEKMRKAAQALNAKRPKDQPAPARA